MATMEELLRAHEKDISKLKNRPSPRQQPGFPMTASSVAGVGVVVAGPGIVEFAASSGNLDIDGIFTPDFEDYLIYLDIYSSTAATNLVAQLRNSGGLYQNLTGYRSGQQTMAYAGASTYSGPVQSGSWTYFGGSSGLGGGSSEIKLFSPGRVGTEVKGTGETVSSSGRVAWWVWCNSAVGLATGLRLNVPSGTITGRLRVYGINPN
jgi:hypothetical protein